jgi:5-methyltetrahydrofolate--homocysteine methyltransferase
MRDSLILLDGGFGTVIQGLGLKPGEDPIDWNIEHPDLVRKVHASYAAAGSGIVLANTFGANRIKYRGKYSIAKIVSCALENASCLGAKVALDIGPSGKLLKPAGDLDFEDAVDAYAQVVKSAMQSENKPDLIFIETFSDLHEIKAAIIAAKENSNLPIYATLAFSDDLKLLTGADVEVAAVLLEALGVDAYGFNCGLSPIKMKPLVEKLAGFSTRPIIVKPNAGMPRIKDGNTVFDLSSEEFAEQVKALVDSGATIAGGCCGTTQMHIECLRERIGAYSPRKRAFVPRSTKVSSGVQAVEFHEGGALVIGERINPTGKKKLQEAFKSGDEAFVLREAVSQVHSGAKILDVNVGVPGLDEVEILPRTVESVMSVVNCPLQIDSSDPIALEKALRRYNGKALVNSVNGKAKSMDAVFPIVKKYGGVIVALCLDENGIPESVQGRIAIAKRILEEGRKYGFSEEDFLFDALTMAVSVNKNAAQVTLETVKRLTKELKVKTVLGVSNVSFQLPQRSFLNNAMYSLAKREGLCAAIANPGLIKDEIVPLSDEVLLGRDGACLEWIAAHSNIETKVVSQELPLSGLEGEMKTLIYSIKTGLVKDAASSARKLAETYKQDSLGIIEKCIIPSLEEVGVLFERGEFYLPQLLLAADAAGAAFEIVNAFFGVSDGVMSNRPIVLATVKGDVHDIGKNIVRSLLANYGFRVIDLGRDVAPERIVECAKGNDAFMVGLSALMTTTVPSMKDTISLLRKSQFAGKVVVGGAVVTQQYADEIGADFYAPDAMAAVRIAKTIS